MTTFSTPLLGVWTACPDQCYFMNCTPWSVLLHLKLKVTVLLWFLKTSFLLKERRAKSVSLSTRRLSEYSEWPKLSKTDSAHLNWGMRLTSRLREPHLCVEKNCCREYLLNLQLTATSSAHEILQQRNDSSITWEILKATRLFHNYINS